MEYASNNEYLLALFVLLLIFKLFELLGSMRVLKSNTHIDTSICEYLTRITHTDLTQLAL